MHWGVFHHVYLAFFSLLQQLQNFVSLFFFFFHLLLFFQADQGASSVVLAPTSCGRGEHLPTLDHPR